MRRSNTLSAPIETSIVIDTLQGYDSAIVSLRLQVMQLGIDITKDYIDEQSIIWYGSHNGHQEYLGRGQYRIQLEKSYRYDHFEVFWDEKDYA